MPMLAGDAYCRATVLIGFVEVVREFGGDGVNLLDEVGIDRAALREVDLLISYRRYALLLELAAQRLARPSFALEWAQRFPEDYPSLGPLALLASYVNSIEEWLDTGLKYWRYHTDAFTLRRLVDEAGHSVLRYHAGSFALPGRQLAELNLAVLLLLGRRVTGHDDIRPSVVRFQHNRPADTNLHEEIFRCPIEFDADHTEAVIDPKFLAYSTSGNRRPFKTLMAGYIKYRINRMPAYDASMTTTVALAIPSILGIGHCGIDDVAASLGLHPKSLQRQLAAEGTNFSEVLNKVRENMARRLLTESDASVERIGGLLDYSATAPFTTACKRWTGMSPLAFRKSERRRLAQPTGAESEPGATE
jgi:AraC-like DNA-binding protein